MQISFVHHNNDTIFVAFCVVCVVHVTAFIRTCKNIEKARERGTCVHGALFTISHFDMNQRKSFPAFSIMQKCNFLLLLLHFLSQFSSRDQSKFCNFMPSFLRHKSLQFLFTFNHSFCFARRLFITSTKKTTTYFRHYPLGNILQLMQTAQNMTFSCCRRFSTFHGIIAVCVCIHRRWPETAPSLLRSLLSCAVFSPSSSQLNRL